MEKLAILVGAITPNMEYDIDYSLKELENLCKASNIKVLDKTSQKLDSINPKYYIGSGKIEEIKLMIRTLDANLVIFDDELSPSQVRNIEKALEVEIMDRSLLILNIFSERANTTEAMLEIELARNKYMLPRLVGLNASLGRQGGTSGAGSSKGAGETQMELDKRRITNEIIKLENKLVQVKKNRINERTKREKSEIPIVSLVGYTNAGKSTTFNTLLNACKKENDKEVFEADMLFATLGTSVRKLTLPNKQQILLIDTVGFVSKLPPLLVNSFRSTLEEIINSSLIIHVIDSSNDYYQNQIKVTKDVLKEIGVDNIKEIYLFNKADKLSERETYFKEDSIAFSNKTKEGLDTLIKRIEEILLTSSNTLVDIKIPMEDGKTISIVEAYGIVKAKIINDNFIYYKTYLPNNQLKNIQKYLYN